MRGDDIHIGIEPGATTPWLVHELRELGLAVVRLDARHARAARKMQINMADQNDAEGLLRSFAPVGIRPFTSRRWTATTRAPLSAQRLNSFANIFSCTGAKRLTRIVCAMPRVRIFGHVNIAY